MSAKKRSLPTPITILVLVIILASVCTWIIPAGEYTKLKYDADAKHFLVLSPDGDTTLPATQSTLDSLGIRIAVSKFTNGEIRKAVSVPGTYRVLEKNPQGVIETLQAPIKGIMDSIDIILFILIIGGFMYVFNETGAMVKGITSLAHWLRGREQWLIILLTVMFSFFAASYGMAEEALVFYPLLVPLFLAAGYDLLVPLAVIFGGTMLGGIPAFSNPFSTIIASNAAGINWMDGLTERLVLFAVCNVVLIVYILRYAARVKRDPSSSLVRKFDGDVKPPYETEIRMEGPPPALGWKNVLLIVIYIGTFIAMIGGVVFLDWWTTEMSALFLASAVLVAFITRIKEKVFVKEFIKGAESLLSVAFIVGIARAVTIVLNEGRISDSILFYTADLVDGMQPAVFILILMVFYALFSFFISSSSGMAVLTMPIIGALIIIVNIPGREVVNSYNYGMALMSFLSPTGLILPSLQLTGVSLKTWFKFIMPFMVIMTLICAASLIVGINL
jgi:uncharacterized ion transporter superfamily protein YfcC